MNDDDRKLFRQSVGDARQLDREPRAGEDRPRPAARARFARRDERQALLETLAADIDELVADSGDALRFQRPSVGRRTMRKLARGSFAVQGEIDLHGMTVGEAKARLADFLDDAVRTGKRCVRVVHGKGLGSGHAGPVLKPNVNRWLRRWDAVLAFVSTRQVHGGTGAVYVLLRDR